MEYIQNILNQMGMISFLSKLLDEEFDKNSFDNLDYDTLRDVIPKAGPRQAFWTAYKKVYGITEIPPTVSTASTISEPISDNTFFISNSSVSDLFENDENINKVLVNTLDTLKEQVINTSLLCPNINNNGKENDVKEYLKCANGQIVLNSYKKNKKLGNRERGLLANTIIHKEYDKCKTLNQELKINKDRFLALVDQIVSEFPTESRSIYFVPYNSEIKLNCSGKLWEVYNRLKKNLRASCDSKNLLNDTLNTQVLEIEDLDGKLKYLETHIKPKQKVKLYWKETYQHRINKLKAEESEGCISNYLANYPALRSKFGCHLLTNDFDHMYPHSANKLFTEWGIINDNIIDLYSKKDVKEIKTLIEFKSDITGFFLLPYLLMTAAYGKKRTNSSRSVKYTTEEISNSFLTVIPDSSLIEEKIAELRKELVEKKSTLQPFIVLERASLNNITASYIILEDVLYVITESPLVAVDICFKIFHSLNVKYPEPCEAIWLFLQKAVYSIKTKYDKNFVAVSELLSDVGKIQ